ncbi:holin superfamily II protein [Ralstonia phage RsoP1IDN]|uniref:Holin superfamily II protein n=1 Tax=Ralstonia phage RsoP1IDN TaxID=2060091 RepID=A0A2P0VPI8_9CAUD|nr:holin [Ralstonia phage RsoP1IDN]AUG85446.1 holin superfamily II protein [Ralstonia phage RsoP1IDN]
MLSREHIETAAEVAKASPTVAYGGMHIWGYPIADWVSVLIAVYTVVQFYFLLHSKLKDKDPE